MSRVTTKVRFVKYLSSRKTNFLNDHMLTKLSTIFHFNVTEHGLVYHFYARAELLYNYIRVEWFLRKNGPSASCSKLSWQVLRSRSRSELVLFGRRRSWSQSQCKDLAPGPISGSTLDKTGEFLNDILFVNSHIDKRLFKKQILIHKWKFSS